MFCFKGNLGSAKGAQVTAQESENNSPPSFTKMIQHRNSLAGFHLPSRHRGSGGEAKENFSLPSHSGSDASDERPDRAQPVTEQRGTTDWGHFRSKGTSSDKTD